MLDFSLICLFYVTAFNSGVIYVCNYIKQSSWKWTIAARVTFTFAWCIFPKIRLSRRLIKSAITSDWASDTLIGRGAVPPFPLCYRERANHFSTPPTTNFRPLRETLVHRSNNLMRRPRNGLRRKSWKAKWENVLSPIHKCSKTCSIIT